MSPEQLKAFMAEHNISCEQLSEICCVGMQTVYAWRGGHRNMPKSAAKLLTLHVGAEA